MLFMLIIKVKYWLFNYKLPLVRLAGGWEAWAGWEVRCHTRQILQITQAGPPRNTWAGIKEIIPGSYSQYLYTRLGSLETLKKFPSVSFQL